MGNKTAILSLKIIGDATSGQKAAATMKNEISGLEKAAVASKKALGLAGAASGVALMAGMSEAISDQADSTRTAAALGLNPTDAAAAGKLAGSLYAGNYGESMEQINDAIDSVASNLAEMSTNGGADVERLSQKALNMASTFGTEVGEGVSTVGILVREGLAKNADEGFDLLIGSMNKVPKEMRSELLPVMDEYARNFAALGIDGTTAFGIMSQAAKGGAIQMDKTGDALKEFTIRATDGSKATGDAYKSIGLDAALMASDIASGGEKAGAAFAKTVAGLQGIEDPAAQAQAAIALFGTPLEDLGTNKVPEFLGAIDPAGDAFDSLSGSADNLGQNLKSPGASMEMLKRTAETSFTSIAASALPVLQPILDLLIQYAPILGPVAAAIAAVAAVTYLVSGATAAYNAAVVIGTGVSKGAAAAQWVWNAAMSANPIGVIILLIAGLVAGIVWAYNNLGWFKDGVNAVGAVAQAIFSGFIDWVMSVVRWLDSVLAPIGGIQGALNIMGTAAGVVFKGITDGIAGMIGWVKDAIGWFNNLFGAKNNANSVQVDGGGSGRGMGRMSFADFGAPVQEEPRSFTYSPMQLTKVQNPTFAAVPTLSLMAAEPAPSKLSGVASFASTSQAVANTSGGAVSSAMDKMTVIHNTFKIEVSATPGTDKVALGRELVSAIKTYERATGKTGG
ncbi:hypothetical protein [Paenarthrobacter ilicis]|uniref:hypothetical protein n=1 Tax=Paenarthrobacter ilicis TaxID=43665 RepID=UPI00386E020A